MLLLFSLFWHFPPNFVLLRLACLVTLFHRNHQVLNKSPKLTSLWHFLSTFVHSKCKRSSLRSQCCKMRHFEQFSNTVLLQQKSRFITYVIILKTEFFLRILSQSHSRNRDCKECYKIEKLGSFNDGLSALKLT